MLLVAIRLIEEKVRGRRIADGVGQVGVGDGHRRTWTKSASNVVKTSSHTRGSLRERHGGAYVEAETRVEYRGVSVCGPKAALPCN